LTTTIGLKDATKNRFDSVYPELGADAKINLLLENDAKLKKVLDTPPEQCEDYHVARDVFSLLNELCDHELTVIDGRDKQKLIDEKLRDLMENAIQKKRHPERWPDYNCAFLKKLDEVSGQCLKDTPEKRYSITASDCWACLKRRKKLREDYVKPIDTTAGKDWMEVYRGKPW